MRAISYTLLGLGLLMQSTHAFVKIWAGEECQVRYESTKSDGKKTWKEWSAPGPWAVLGEEGQRFEVIMKPKDNDSFGRTAECHIEGRGLGTREEPKTVFRINRWRGHKGDNRLALDFCGERAGSHVHCHYTKSDEGLKCRDAKWRHRRHGGGDFEVDGEDRGVGSGAAVAARARLEEDEDV